MVTHPLPRMCENTTPTYDQKTFYSKTCLNRTPLGLENLFSLDRCLVYTGSNYIVI